MNRHSRSFARLHALLLAVALLAVAVPAHATTVLAVPVPELAKGSPVVVRGVVESRKTAWDAAHLNIETRTTVRVTRRFKGEAPAHVVVSQVGGELDGKGQYVPGDATFDVNEDVVLFLEARPDGTFVLTGMAMSKFRVVEKAGGTVLTRELGGLAFAGRDAQGVIRATATAPASELTLAALESMFVPAPARPALPSTRTTR